MIDYLFCGFVGYILGIMTLGIYLFVYVDADKKVIKG
jgi:hypothetical protein